MQLVIKAVLYRISSWLITFIVIFVFTHNFPATTFLTLFIEGLKTFWYYTYDKLWLWMKSKTSGTNETKNFIRKNH